MGNSDQQYKEDSAIQNNSQQFADHISGLFEDAISQQKHNLEKEANRLFSIIERLEAENNHLQAQLKASESAYQNRLHQIRSAINEMFTGDNPNHDVSQNPDETPSSIPSVNNPISPSFNTALETQYPQKEIIIEKESTVIELKPNKKKKQLRFKRIKNRVPVVDSDQIGGLRKWALTAVAACVLAGFAYGTWQLFLAPYWQYRYGSIAKENSGQVAGASTEKKVVPNQNDTGESLDNQYPESFATLPYDQTVWDTVTDSEFGISMKYPKNTTNRVRILGGSNLWFLRFNGYFMKFTKIETKLDLTGWWENNKIDYQDGQTVDVAATFNNNPAVEMKSTEKTATSGTTYFIKKGEYILQIWIKDEDPASDDGKRLATMIESLQISQPK